MTLATLAGIGRTPHAPGTAGTLITLPACPLLWRADIELQWILLATLSALGVWAASRAALLLQRDDPKEVVIDEAAGMMLTTLLAPHGWIGLTAGFILFRILDIWKPGPIRWLEHTLPNGWGIMADDLLAGALAGGLLNLIARAYPFPPLG